MKHRSTFPKQTFLGLTTSEWVRLNLFLATVLGLLFGVIILPSLIGH